jgi:aspartate/methionine/tyrosine aminotransferase
MERWQSTYEHRVRFNLSESGVHPMTLDELLEIAGEPLSGLGGVRFGYGQSNGSDELRARIAAMYPGAGEANVLATVGGAEANFVCHWHLMEPGEAAAVMVPNYMQVPGLMANFGVEALPFRLTEETGWEPDLDALDEALEAGARFVLVTNPNNPTGKILREATLDALVERADRHGAWIISDEVYRGAETGGDTSPTLWGRYDRVLVTNSLSKAYGLPGLRLGWVLGPEDVVADLWGRTDYTTITPTTLSDRLACLALEATARTRVTERARRIVRENLAATREWLDARPGLFRYRAPDAGAIVYVRYTADVNSAEFAEKLRVEKDVLVVPGDHFGMDRYLRIGFGPPRGELMEALGRIAEAFDEVGAPA